MKNLKAEKPCSMGILFRGGGGKRQPVMQRRYCASH